MAVSMADRIHALSGFDANSTSDSATGEDYDEMAAQWMTDATREVINLLPIKLFERSAKVSAAFAPTTGATAHENKVLSAIRAKTTSFNDGEVFDCRQVSHTLANKAKDESSLEYATETDPIWYYEPQTDLTAIKVKILPASTDAIAKIYSIDYPVFTAGDTETYDVCQKTKIENFPDEAENAVILRAAMYAAEYQMAIEEDIDLYGIIIGNLRNEYAQSISSLTTGKLIVSDKKDDD